MSENTGQGSSGSWREDDVDTTKHGKPKKKSEWQGNLSASENKLGAFEGRQRDHVHYQPIGVRAKERQRKLALAGAAQLKPMRFVSLHHHSTFSFLDGFQMPEAHVRRAEEINMGTFALTEHGNIFSHVKLEKAAEGTGVKPIFGCEFYCGYTDEARRTQKKNHLTVIAATQDGYRNLLELVTMSWKEGFYYEPTISYEWLFERQKGLVVLSGCTGSALFTAVVGGKHVSEEDASYARGLKVAKWFSKRLDNYYIEVQAFPELEQVRRANPLLARIARAIGRPLVATKDVHYTAPEEAEVQKVLHNLRPGNKQTLEEQERDWGYDVPLCPPTSDKAIYNMLVGTGLSREQAIEAIVSTEEIGQACNVTLPKLEPVLYPIPEEYGDVDPVEHWEDLLREGWKYRDIKNRKNVDEYKAQLKREMTVIKDKNYVNYFLIVGDAVRFAKESGIPVGPARGSAAASLVCYLLRITEVDPMDYPHLVFERFIDYSRDDMPDIDIDFATYGRPIVRDYLIGRYGEGCVNNIGTFTEFKSKNSLDYAGRVHHVPKKEVEAVKELLLERSSGDLRASATIEDTVDQFDVAYDVFTRYPELTTAMDLEGNMFSHGVHAAGLVVSARPLKEISSILEKEVPAGSGNVVQVVALDKKDAERQGINKLDFLSLSTMDLIAEAMDYLDMSVEDLYAIPLDDPETIKGFQQNDVVGVFQFDGRATRYVNSEVRCDSFHEVALLVALSRPGPLHNGAVDGYVDVKWRGAQPDYIHPALEHITGDTNGQIVYQEQIMRIVRDVGDFDWAGTAGIRKIIAQKLGEQEFNRQYDRFEKGALTVHERMDVPPMDKETVKKIWGMMTVSGAYAFNAAHSVSYGMIAFWCMWFKVHHPAAFYGAALAKLPEGKNQVRHMALRRDALKHDIDILPPTIDSGIGWTIVSDSAVASGWSQIPGIGEKKAQAIVDARDAGELESYEDLAKIKGFGPAIVDKVLQFVHKEDPFSIMKLERDMAKVTEALKEGMMGANGKRLPVPTNTPSNIESAPGGSRVVMLAQPTNRNLRDIFEANRKKGEELDVDKVKRPDLAQWVVFGVRDSDEQSTVIISRFVYPRLKDLIWKMELNKNELVLMSGRKPTPKAGQGNQPDSLVFVDKIWVIEP